MEFLFQAWGHKGFALPRLELQNFPPAHNLSKSEWWNYIETLTLPRMGHQKLAEDSGFVFRLLLRLGNGLCVVVFHTLFQCANAIAQPLAQLRQSFGAENNQCDDEDHQQVHGLK